MAILSKIRERSLFLIIVIGLALFAFVLDPSAIADFFSANKVNEVGEVNGETITRQQFANALERYKTQTGGRVSEMQAAKTVWNNLLRQKVYETQLVEAGITIGEADIMSSLYDVQFVKDDPRFQSAGVFNKEKLKEHLATIKAEDSNEWRSWQNYMLSLKENLQKSTYDNLVGAGLGASLKEGEAQYLSENTNIDADLVYVPFTSDTTSVTVKKSEIEDYLKKHSTQYQVESSRDIKYVKFDIKATSEDEDTIKEEVATLLKDEDRNGLSIKGLKNTTDYKAFFLDNKSDTPLNENAQFKANLPKVVAENIFNGTTNDTFGPYKDGNYIKISKITEVLNLPDSVKASHILIPFKGSNAATATTTKTEQEAKKTADSIYKLVRSNKDKYKEIADTINPDGTKGKGGDIGWVRYNTAFSPNFDTDFANFMYNNKVGTIDVVKTKFGFHIIRVDDKTSVKKAVKLATYSREIEASEQTENAVYQNAETLGQALNNNGNFDDIIKEKNLSSKSAVNLKALDENVPGIGKERQIVTWAFEQDLEVGDYKRFDIDGGYIVATLTGKTAKGLMPVDKATTTVRPILVKEKKAAILKAKMTGATLEEIAKASGQRTKKVTGVNLKSPTISGVGFEPKIVGAMLNAQENKLYSPIIGDKGVFAFVVSKKELPTALPNYNTIRNRIASQRKSKSYNMYEAIKKASNVEDNMSSFYGIQ